MSAETSVYCAYYYLALGYILMRGNCYCEKSDWRLAAGVLVFLGSYFIAISLLTLIGL